MKNVLTQRYINVAFGAALVSSSVWALSPGSNFQGLVVNSEYRDFTLPSFSVRRSDAEPGHFELSSRKPIVFESRRTGRTVISGVSGTMERQCENHCVIRVELVGEELNIAGLPAGSVSLIATVPTDKTPAQWLSHLQKGGSITNSLPEGTQMRLRQHWDKGDMLIRVHRESRALWAGSGVFGSFPILLMTIQEMSSCKNIGYAGNFFQKMKPASIFPKTSNDSYQATFKIDTNGGHWVGAPDKTVRGCA